MDDRSNPGQFNMNTSFYIEDKEYDLKWKTTQKQDEVMEIGQYIINEILKAYKSDSVIMKDKELQEYNLEEIIHFQIHEIFVYIPSNKSVKTFVNNEARNFKSILYFLSSSQIKIEKFKNRTVPIESVFISLSIIKKQNAAFEKTLSQIVQSRINNMKLQHSLSLSGSLPKLNVIEGDNDLHPLDDEDENNNQQPSPKFGAQQNPQDSQSMSNSLLGSNLKQEDQDLKSRNKVAGQGTQADYMRNQHHHLSLEAKGLSMEEVSEHNHEGDAWTVINGKIYDITQYLNYHPGGKEKLMLGAGRDGTELFMKYHPWVNAHYILQKNQVGFVILK